MASPALRRQVKEIIDRSMITVGPEQKALQEISLRDFTRWAWQILEPATPMVGNWTFDCIADHVEALLNGKLGKQNLLIMVPPGFAKSTIVSVCAPVWRWIQRPSWRALLASGNERVSTRDSLKRRQLITNDAFRKVFSPLWKLAEGSNLKTRYSNTAMGFHSALSTGQAVTGDRADHLGIDDPADAATIHSEAERQAVERWFFEAYANRLSNMTTGTRVIIQQRLHSLDLAGMVLEKEPDAWEVVTIPMLWEENRRVTTSLGWTDPRTQDGELAFPSRFPQEVVDAEKVRLGRSAFSAQHQQQPFDAEGEIFRPSAIQIWQAGKELPQFKRRILSLDTAFSIKSTADYSVIMELGLCDHGVFILSVLRRRLEYPQLKMAAITMAEQGGISAVLVEDKASGQSLAQDLRQTTRLPVLPIKVDSDKVTRAHVVVPTVEAGRVFAPAGAPWLNDFLNELAAFPKGKNDDIVDAFTQGVNFLSHFRSGPSPWEGFILFDR